MHSVWSGSWRLVALLCWVFIVYASKRFGQISQELWARYFFKVVVRNESAFLTSVGRVLINFSGAGHSVNMEWACMLAGLFLAV